MSDSSTAIVGQVGEAVIPRPTKRQRRRLGRAATFGSRPVNNWGEGDLPAPFAEGDLLWLPEPYEVGRMRGMGQPGWYVVTYATSIDEGDAWYFRVTNDPDNGSDRMHVVYADRSDFDEDHDWMAPFLLVETTDPEGMFERERLLADGWTFTSPPRCDSCGQRVYGQQITPPEADQNGSSSAVGLGEALQQQPGTPGQQAGDDRPRDLPGEQRHDGDEAADQQHRPAHADPNAPPQERHPADGT